MKLEEWEDECDAHMLKSAGVYAILNEDNEVMYVGEAENFLKRWGQHCAGQGPVPPKKIFKFVVLEYEDNKSNRLRLERAWHIDCKPKYGGRCHLGRSEGNITNYHKLLKYKKSQGQEHQYDPSPEVETNNEALEDELRYLNTEIE